MDIGNESWSEESLNEYLDDLKKQAIIASTYARVIPGAIPIGAAGLANNYKIYKGCYYPGSTGYTTVHAEHAALINAVSHGATKILCLAVFAGTEKLQTPPVPCGSCLQAIADMANIGPVKIYTSCKSSFPQWNIHSIGELLPFPWKHPKFTNLLDNLSDNQ